MTVGPYECNNCGAEVTAHGNTDGCMRCSSVDVTAARERRTGGKSGVAVSVGDRIMYRGQLCEVIAHVVTPVLQARMPGGFP